jgi:hypothetical protein
MLMAFLTGLLMALVILIYNYLLWVILARPVRSFFLSLEFFKGTLLGLILVYAYAFIPMFPEFYLIGIIRGEMLSGLSLGMGSHEDLLYMTLVTLAFVVSVVMFIIIPVFKMAKKEEKNQGV